MRNYSPALLAEQFCVCMCERNTFHICSPKKERNAEQNGKYCAPMYILSESNMESRNYISIIH